MQYELRLKEGDEIQFKRKQEAICKKMEVDCQLYKDDVQRVEQEISNLHLRLSLEDVGHFPADLISELEPERSQTYSRLCLMCMEKEASVVFLPCAHQVLCARCNENHCRNVGYISTDLFHYVSDLNVLDHSTPIFLLLSLYS
ncbi:hypothetical protein Q3G72_021444 [Acer saccharum]|nr:hypothetical protein Q3G72_021444 [Acer saccharum]